MDAKVKAAVKEALAQVADALECACCFASLAPRVRVGGGRTERREGEREEGITGHFVFDKCKSCVRL